ncbi:MAG: hypothetical protein CMO07_13190 [Thalassospira sp.]|uniref:Abi family protein n=1 Tax=Thalassospira sp. UBA4513 TaxID=1947675 RepID=UPI000C5715F7|nr:Abi family protein [Thalassospira sp. UBA4513]MBE71641.1 hypothetical protein [Thalassospira sp.]HAI30316.1 hypothetical protein [Thalassospira sp.]HBL43825.1 hypothetical protein [Planctomycetaceae bacterium]|tara:strand:+ start:1847 stop:2620 length:774 start_codon:yes stop_codon:yes gene_type:complete
MQVTRDCRPYNVDRLGRDYQPGADPRFIKTLSQSRFNVYLREANQDSDLAFRLYRWNMLLAETFLMPCHLMEVALRNGLSAKMWARFGAEWPLQARLRGDWDADPRLDQRMRQLHWDAHAKIVDQREQIIAHRETLPNPAPVTSDCVIAQLSLGFWTNMFSARYRGTLWSGSALRSVLPNHPMNISSDDVYTKLGNVREIRNRVAHHEVIFTKDPEARYRDLVELCTWLNPDLGHFVETTSHFDTVFAARPQANQAG